MILNTEEITTEIGDRTRELAKQVFETDEHPDQMQPSPATIEKLKSLNPNTVLYEVIDGAPVAWVVVVPTTTQIADKFLNKEIGEQMLLDLTPVQNTYSALYLCAAATVPEYRRKGIAARLIREAVSRMPMEKDFKVFAWPTTKEGSLLLKKFEEETGKVIPIRQ